MKNLLPLLLVLVLCSCEKKEYSQELVEDGEVYDTTFVPKGHGSDTAVGFTSGGNVSITPIDVTIPARYAVVFKCQHGKFVIDGTDGEREYKHLDKGDRVKIHYREVFVKGAVVDLDFGYAEKVKE